MIEVQRRKYALQLNPRAGIVERLRFAADVPEVNLVHKDGVSAFGSVVHTRTDEPWRWEFTGSPIRQNNFEFSEYRTFNVFEHETGGEHCCANPMTGTRLRYRFDEDSFDIRLEADMPQADQIGLDLNPAFLDLRQNDRCTDQFTVKSWYTAPDRSLSYVYFQRVGHAEGILMYTLDAAAGWRIRYGRGFVVEGFQMLARFSHRIDSYGTPGTPAALAVRVAMADSLEAGLARMREELELPQIIMPVLSTQTGGSLAYKVEGVCTKLALRCPDGAEITPAPERLALEQEGFYYLTATGPSGRTMEVVLQAAASYFETLERARRHLQPVFGYCAEKFYWVQAMALARKSLGEYPPMEPYLHDALSCVGMQGCPDIFPGPIPDAASTRERLERKSSNIDPFPVKDGFLVGAPVPFAQEYHGRTLSPWHIWQLERIQDAFAFVQTYLYAARAYDFEPYYEHAVKIGLAHIHDHVDSSGRVQCVHGGAIVIDYTTVISPALALAELYREMDRRRDPRTAEVKDACVRIADYLLRRGFEFPTEGCSVHERWTEDGSISCTALSLMAVDALVQPDARYRQRAREVLDFHDAWRLEAPDVRARDGSYRYWETQWENDGEGHAINAGHAWGLWRAEALFWLGVREKDGKALLQSYNGFRNNLAKYMPDGTAYTCFTPDYLPQRPVRMELCHCYPVREDLSLAYYLWPRLWNTWLDTAAVIEDADGHPLALNGDLVPTDGGWSFRSWAPEWKKLLVLTNKLSGLQVPDHVEIIR